MIPQPDAAKILNHYADALKLKGKADTTIAVYMADAVRMLDLIGVHPLEITREHLYRWDAGTASRDLAPNTRSRYRVSAKLFLRFLSQHYDHPPLHLELGELRSQLVDPKLPHPDDIRDILHAQDETNLTHARDAAIIALLAGTGIRLSECVALNIGDVTIRKVPTTTGERLTWSFRLHARKGRKYLRDINAGRADDTTDTLTRHFGLWFLRRVTDLGGHKVAAALPLFADEADPRRRLIDRTVRKRVTAAAKRAGRHDLAAWLHPHSFRHYFATYYLINEGKMLSLQMHLGHASMLTTQQYVHLGDKVTAAQVIKANPLKDVIAKPMEKLTNDALGRLVTNLVPSAA